MYWKYMIILELDLNKLILSIEINLKSLLNYSFLNSFYNQIPKYFTTFIFYTINLKN